MAKKNEKQRILCKSDRGLMYSSPHSFAKTWIWIDLQTFCTHYLAATDSARGFKKCREDWTACILNSGSSISTKKTWQETQENWNWEMATAKQLLGHVWDRVTNHREEAKGSKPLYVKLAFCSQSLLNSSYCVLLLTLPEALHCSRGAWNLRYPSFQNPRNTSANDLIL